MTHLDDQTSTLVSCLLDRANHLMHAARCFCFPSNFGTLQVGFQMMQIYRSNGKAPQRFAECHILHLLYLPKMEKNLESRQPNHKIRLLLMTNGCRDSSKAFQKVKRLQLIAQTWPCSLQQFLNTMSYEEMNIVYEAPAGTGSTEEAVEDLGISSLCHLSIEQEEDLYLDQFLVQEDKRPWEEVEEPIEVVDFEEMPDCEVEPMEETIEPAKEDLSNVHNFQKHLVMCLRRCVEPEMDASDATPHVQAAHKMWRIFKKSKCHIKKILHFMLGAKNEHQISSSALRSFGLFRVYQEFDEATLTEARVFLSQEVQRQLEGEALDFYLKGRQLKEKGKFRKYMEFFLDELRAGCLKKRLLKAKIKEIMRC